MKTNYADFHVTTRKIKSQTNKKRKRKEAQTRGTKNDIKKNRLEIISLNRKTEQDDANADGRWKK